VTRLLAATAFVALALVAAGCAPTGGPSRGDSDPTVDDTGTDAASQPLPDVSGELMIYAAASLKAAFEELATDFEERHPSLEVLPVVSDGSSTLATQLIEGAPADLFASADEATMQRLVEAGVAATAQVFATNTLVVATPASDPGEVDELADLADDSVTVVLCAPEVPCGAASQTLLAKAGVSVVPASWEQSVTAVLTKVAAGEADAGLVYATDVRSRTDVDSFVPPGASAVVARSPLAALTDSANPAAAAAFAEFVLGADGQAVLAELGFGSP
jgi:molybdate transport system substrate-binding protein